MNISSRRVKVNSLLRYDTEAGALPQPGRRSLLRSVSLFPWATRGCCSPPQVSTGMRWGPSRRLIQNAAHRRSMTFLLATPQTSWPRPSISKIALSLVGPDCTDTRNRTGFSPYRALRIKYRVVSCDSSIFPRAAAADLSTFQASPDDNWSSTVRWDMRESYEAGRGRGSRLRVRHVPFP